MGTESCGWNFPSHQCVFHVGSMSQYIDKLRWNNIDSSSLWQVSPSFQLKAFVILHDASLIWKWLNLCYCINDFHSILTTLIPTTFDVEPKFAWPQGFALRCTPTRLAAVGVLVGAAAVSAIREGSQKCTATSAQRKRWFSGVWTGESNEFSLSATFLHRFLLFWFKSSSNSLLIMWQYSSASKLWCQILHGHSTIQTVPEPLSIH